VLALLGEACLFADQIDEASTVAQRALDTARDRGQRGDAAAALYVLGEAAARTSLEVGTAERHYHEAIALTAELEMYPLLARTHLGIGRLYLRAGDRGRAEDHVLSATRMFITMDMPFWLRQAVASLSELGRDLIVARDQPNLYEYLVRALPSNGTLDVVMEAPDAGPVVDDERMERMLRSHGLIVTGSN